MGIEPGARASARPSSNEDHHRALPDQGRRADPAPQHGAPRGVAPRGRLQPVQDRCRARADRSAHRQRHGRHECAAVGRDHARGRELRGFHQLPPPSRCRPGHHGLRADAAHPPGASQRTNPLRTGRRGREDRAEQRPLRHDAGEHRAQWRPGRRPGHSRSGGSNQSPPLQGQSRPGPARVAACRRERAKFRWSCAR